MTASEPGRFAVAAIGREGVVLDAATGELYRAGATAVVVFRALAASSGVSGAADALVQAFDVTHARAERDVRAILASMSERPRRRHSSAPAPQFRASARGGYELRLDGRPAAWLDERGRIVERGSRSETSSGTTVLRLVAPHVLALGGRRVLHASAVLHRGEVTAFVAPSGTGKTTIARLLARLFAHGGVRAVSEDLLVLRGARAAVLDGERTLRAWSRSRAHTVSTEPALASAVGPARPLRAVLVLERRKGQRGIALEALRGADAIMALFANAFVEVPSPRVWRAALVMCRSLAARGIVYRACVPDGLSALEEALAARASRPSARASEADDGVEALLGIRSADPRMAEAVTA